jgi:hypothetical protein
MSCAIGSTASADMLSNESQLLRILLIARGDADPAEPAIEIIDSPRMTLALLRSAHGEVVSQSIGSHAVRRSAHLEWDALVALFGDEGGFVSA